MDPKVKSYIQDFIRDNEAIVISAVVDGKPHVATVYYSEDKDCKNLYFTSANHRDHSKYYLDQSPETAAAIFAYDKDDLGVQEGIQLQGHIYRVTNVKEALSNFAHYFMKLPFAKQFFTNLEETVDRAAHSSLYKIEIHRLKFFSHHKDLRVEEYSDW